MQMSELTALLTPTGLRMLDDLPELHSTEDVSRAVSQLRAAGRPPELVSVVVTQARLRSKAHEKFGDLAENMLFTRNGLEQATRISLSARHAARFRDAGVQRVADLGCGIGGDSLGLAALHLDVTAVDSDAVTAAIAGYNLAAFGDAVQVQHGQAEDFARDLESAWLDPARREIATGARTRVQQWSPALPWAFELATGIPCGIKLGPGMDRSLIPSDAEAQWISAGGATTELVLWTGSLARPQVRRAALITRGEASWELTASDDAADEPVRSLGSYIHEPDGAVIRARLIGDVARALDAGMLAERIAYLTSDAALTSPMVKTFRVREQLPADRKALASALRARNIGTLEIKKRGVDIDPARLRTELKLRGDEAATLILTRIAGKRVAVLADRVDAD